MGIRGGGDREKKFVFLFTSSIHVLVVRIVL